MATTKRERQRANRELRKAELRKQEARAKLRRRVSRWSKIAVVVAVLFILSNLIVGRFSNNEPETTTTTTLVETTLAP